jgi:hypothetical protein
MKLLTDVLTPRLGGLHIRKVAMQKINQELSYANKFSTWRPQVGGTCPSLA